MFARPTNRKYLFEISVKLTYTAAVQRLVEDINNIKGILMSSSEAQTHLPDWSFDDEFDGGDETCGRVIVNLHLYIRDQAPGSRILVISRDPGAPVELPAWCRMTRNELTENQHPYYLITLKPHLLRN